MKSETRSFQISRPVVPPIETMLADLRAVLESGQLTNGKHVARFEAACKEYLGEADVVAVSSNTLGMMLGWRALELSGEVLVPAFTFPATAHVLLWNGLEPVLVDCDRSTFNVDVADAERKITDRTVGIAPVYIFGNPPDWTAITSLAKRHALRVISDAAHAFGTLVDGKLAGNFGDFEVFSLAPTKILTTGEGGLVTTRNAEMASRLRRTRNYGNPGDYNCRELGLNARMTEIHAILGIHGLPGHEAQLAHRQNLAVLYHELLSKIPGISFQRVPEGSRSTYNYFAILIEPAEFGATNKDVYAALAEGGVESKIYFHPPLHKQTLYRHLDVGSFPNTEWVCDRILCLPITGHLDEGAVETIVGIIRGARGRVRVKEDARS